MVSYSCMCMKQRKIGRRSLSSFTEFLFAAPIETAPLIYLRMNNDLYFYLHSNRTTSKRPG